MSRKIDGLSYSDNLFDIMQNAAIGPSFMAGYFLVQHELNLMRKRKVLLDLLRQIGVKNAAEMSDVIAKFRSNDDHAIKAAEERTKKRGARMDDMQTVDDLVKNTR